MKLGITLTTFGGLVLLLSIAIPILLGYWFGVSFLGLLANLILYLIVGSCIGGIPLYWGIERIKNGS